MSNLHPLPEVASCVVAPLVREPLNPPAAAEMAARFKALADPVRLQLLSSVASRAGGEACVCDISAGVEVSQPTISHHLKVLRDAGLLTSRRRASWVYYAVVPEALTVLSNLLSVHADAATSTRSAMRGPKSDAIANAPSMCSVCGFGTISTVPGSPARRPIPIR